MGYDKIVSGMGVIRRCFHEALQNVDSLVELLVVDGAGRQIVQVSQLAG